MNNQEKKEETFCIDDLMDELYLYVKAELQTAGKPEIEVDIIRYTDKYACRIGADRERLRQVFVHLLDNSVKYTDSGLILFGYFVMDNNLVDFVVDDTRRESHRDDTSNLTPVRNLLKPTGSRLKKSSAGMGYSIRFSIESEYVA